MKTFRKMMKDKVYKFSGHDYGTFAYIPNDSILELTGAADIKVTTDVGYNVLITLSGQSKLTIHGNVVKAQFVLNGFSQLHFSNVLKKFVSQLLSGRWIFSNVFFVYHAYASSTRLCQKSLIPLNQ